MRIVAVLLLALAGCATTPTAQVPPEPMPANYELAKQQAEAVIRGALKDPDSGQFQDWSQFAVMYRQFTMLGSGVDPLWALCVRVNAKNAMGGYTGFKPWYVKFENGVPINKSGTGYGYGSTFCAGLMPTT